MDEGAAVVVTSATVGSPHGAASGSALLPAAPAVDDVLPFRSTGGVSIRSYKRQTVSPHVVKNTAAIKTLR